MKYLLIISISLMAGCKASDVYVTTPPATRDPASEAPQVPSEPGYTGDKEQFLIERSNGFNDGCMAAIGSKKKCEKLLDAYMDQLLRLVD